MLVLYCRALHSTTVSTVVRSQCRFTYYDINSMISYHSIIDSAGVPVHVLGIGGYVRQHPQRKRRGIARVSRERRAKGKGEDIEPCCTTVLLLYTPRRVARDYHGGRLSSARHRRASSSRDRRSGVHSEHSSPVRASAPPLAPFASGQSHPGRKRLNVLSQVTQLLHVGPPANNNIDRVRMLLQ